jgi:AcrR family transcriptional regulator
MLGREAMVGKRGRKRNDPALSMAEIKDAAIQLFARNGYANASLEQIAAAAKFTKGAIYYYFRSKERLLLQILDDIEARSVTRTAEAVKNCQGSTVDRLIEFNFSQARWAASYPNDLAILMLTSIESANRKGKVTNRIAKIYDTMRAILDGILDDAKAQGEIPKTASTRELVLAIMAIHDGNMLLWYRSGLQPETGRLLTAAATRTILDRYNELRADRLPGSDTSRIMPYG